MTLLLSLTALQSYALDCSQFNLEGKFRLSNEAGATCDITMAKYGVSGGVRFFEVVKTCPKWPSGKGELFGIGKYILSDCSLVFMDGGNPSDYPITQDSTPKNMKFTTAGGAYFFKFDRL